MNERTLRTQATYDKIAEEFLRVTRHPRRSRRWLDSFAAALPAGAVVADLGSGPGRDSGQLRKRGCLAYCFDRSQGMLRAGADEFPAPRTQADLRCLPIASESVAGAWANASLLHLSPEDLTIALAEIHRILAPGGRLHLTLKRGEGSGWERERYGEPRWFQFWSAAELDPLLAAAGLAIVESAEEDTSNASWLVRQCTKALPSDAARRGS